MGLDLVELVMEVEDRFGVEFDYELDRVHTAGDLLNLILLKKEDAPAPVCPSLRIFCRLRTALMELFDRQRREIRPATPMDRLVPQENRRENWERLEESLGMRLPRLARPLWLVVGELLGGLLYVSVLTLLAFAKADALGAPAFLFAIVVFLILPVSLVLAVGLHRATRPPAVFLPGSCATVGDMVRSLDRLNFVVPTRALQDPRREVVWSELRELTARQLNVPVEKVTPEASIVDL